MGESTPGETAYDNYWPALGSAPPVPWDGRSPVVHRAWEAAAQAVLAMENEEEPGDVSRGWPCLGGGGGVSGRDVVDVACGEAPASGVARSDAAGVGADARPVGGVVMPETPTPGEIAYTAYMRKVHGGWPWRAVREASRAGWEVAAQAVLEACAALCPICAAELDRVNAMDGLPRIHAQEEEKRHE